MSTIAERIKRMNEPGVFHGNSEVFVHRFYDGWTGMDFLHFCNQNGRHLRRELGSGLILLPDGTKPKLHVWESRRVKTLRKEFDDDKLIHKFFIKLYPETKSDKDERIKTYGRNGTSKLDTKRDIKRLSAI